MSPAAHVCLLLIRGYQVTFGNLLPSACRYTPSCSRYTALAIEKYGALRGSWLGARRILRCHPFGGSGFDPVP